MSELLIELYGEEIPAVMQKNAEQELQRIFTEKLKSYEVQYSSLRLFVAPTRIAIIISDVNPYIAAKSVSIKGPKADAPEKALSGFLKGHNISSEDLVVNEINGVKYYFYDYSQPKQLTSGILPELIVDSFKAYVWPKSMYWGNYNFSWVRPVKNLLCVYDGDILDVSLGHLQSNNITYGHKFLSNIEIKVNSSSDYLKNLVDNYVILDRSLRQEMIKEQLTQIAETHQLTLDHDDKLLEEVTGLVEYPTVMIGRISDEFLHVPSEVLVSAMREHQKYFTAKRANGDFAPYFLFAANIFKEDNSGIISGNEKVLSARLADAKFFFEQDLQTNLDDMLKKLSKVTYHANLGSVAEHSERTKTLCELLAPGDQQVLMAASYAKADLVSGVVDEFPDLQGVMGYYYSMKAGMEEEVAQAIYQHYWPSGKDGQVPKGVAAVVALADKINNIVGLSLAGEKATSSKDPYALRRTALGVMKILISNQISISLQELLGWCVDIYKVKHQDLLDNYPSIITDLLKFFEERAKYFFLNEFEHKIVAAILDFDISDDLVLIHKKLSVLQEFLVSNQGTQLLQIFKRAYNLVESEKISINSLTVNESMLSQKEEIELWQKFTEVNLQINSSEQDFQKILLLLSELNDPINSFFGNVMIKTEDSKVSVNRMAILAAIIKLFDRFVKFAILI